MMLSKVVIFVHFLGSKKLGINAPVRFLGTSSEIFSRHMSGSCYGFYSYIVGETEFMHQKQY